MPDLHPQNRLQLADLYLRLIKPIFVRTKRLQTVCPIYAALVMEVGDASGLRKDLAT